VKKLKAIMHKSAGSIGSEILKIKCEYDGEVIPFASCKEEYCKANVGHFHWKEEGEWKGLAHCGLEEMQGGKK